MVEKRSLKHESEKESSTLKMAEEEVGEPGSLISHEKLYKPDLWLHEKNTTLFGYATVIGFLLLQLKPVLTDAQLHIISSPTTSYNLNPFP